MIIDEFGCDMNIFVYGFNLLMNLDVRGQIKTGTNTISLFPRNLFLRIGIAIVVRL